MASFTVYAHRFGVRLAYIMVAGAAVGLAYTAGDACFALGRIVGAGH